MNLISELVLYFCSIIKKEMGRNISKFLFKISGWRYNLNGLEVPKKCVLCAAPHTSNWDFYYGLIFYRSIGGNPHILMKKELFVFPFNYLLRKLGGIPVDRRSKNRTSLTDQMVGFFQSEDNFHLAIAPEGTRKKTKEWKSGFYHIALAAKVPIALAYIDYKKKEIGFFEIFEPTGDKDKDIAYIKSLYKDVTAKYPDLF